MNLLSDGDIFSNHIDPIISAYQEMEWSKQFYQNHMVDVLGSIGLLTDETSQANCRTIGVLQTLVAF